MIPLSASLVTFLWTLGGRSGGEGVLPNKAVTTSSSTRRYYRPRRVGPPLGDVGGVTNGGSMASRIPSSSETDMVTPRNLQVCLSPACVADGAQETFELLQALAPPNVQVEAGPCTSLCGSGPIVVVAQQQQSADQTKATLKKEKRMQSQNDDKILAFLYPPDQDEDTTNGNLVAKKILQGYRWVQQGDAAFGKQDHKQALEWYQKAITIAYSKAVELQNERDRVWKQQSHPTTTGQSGGANSFPPGLNWLVRTRRNEAICHMKCGDLDAAMLACQSSCNLSRNTSAESFGVLAEIYKLENTNLEGEAQALEKALSLWKTEEEQEKSQPGNTKPAIDFAQKNQRRLAALRLDKVRRELSS